MYEMKSTSLPKLIKALTGGLQSVTNMPFKFHAPVLGTPLQLSPKLGVLIEMKGDISGMVLIDSPKEVFVEIANTLYGMQLEGEMLDSFIAELGNIIAGRTSTYLSKNNIIVDILPPNTQVSISKISEFKKAITIPSELGPKQEFALIFLFDDITN
jgi:chemotaxis protein CheX